MLPYQCLGCKHLEPGSKCKAFPDGIPVDVLQMKFDHTKVHPDQVGKTVFEPMENQGEVFEDIEEDKFIDTDISGFKVVKPGKTDKPKDQAENE